MTKSKINIGDQEPIEIDFNITSEQIENACKDSPGFVGDPMYVELEIWTNPLDDLVPGYKYTLNGHKMEVVKRRIVGDELIITSKKIG